MNSAQTSVHKSHVLH